MITLLKMKIEKEEDGNFFIVVENRSNKDSVNIEFNVLNKELLIDESNGLGKFLKRNEYQFRKLLHNKRPDIYKVGFELLFSIIDKKDIEKFNDKNNIVITDMGKIYVVKQSKKQLINIYTDGSYNEKRKIGAYGYLIEKDNKIIFESYKKTLSKSSSHIELLAVIDAIKNSKFLELRIFTDSQYVRKGITEWILHWRENGFTTANGTRAKNVEDWLELDGLIKNKYIEWVWIKGHRDNVFNNIVDKNVGDKAKEE